MLFWISNGKANRDIGDILGLSPRTVNKHLELVYQKLGVESRAAAAILALRALGTGDAGSTPERRSQGPRRLIRLKT